MKRPMLASALAIGLAMWMALGVRGANAQATPTPLPDRYVLPVASSIELDPGVLDRRARSALDVAAPDLRIAALLAVDAPPSPSLRILMPVQTDAAPRRVTVVAENLADDAVASVLTRLVFDRRADGSWYVASARRAFSCRRGEATDRFVKGPCP